MRQAFVCMLVCFVKSQDSSSVCYDASKDLLQRIPFESKWLENKRKPIEYHRHKHHCMPRSPMKQSLQRMRKAGRSQHEKQ